MRKHEVIYDWPIAEITRLADSDIAAAFSDGLQEPRQSQFVTLTETMRNLGAEMAARKAQRTHFTRWTDLRASLDEFRSGFPTFPGLELPRFELFAMVASGLAQSVAPFDMEEIDPAVFELVVIDEKFPLPWFSRENLQSFADSAVVFSLVDIAALELEFAKSSISNRLAFHLLLALHGAGPLAGRLALVKRSPQPLSQEAVGAFIRMLVLTTGRAVHPIHKYLNAPCVLEPDAIRHGNPYQQWADVLIVLSEYNSREEILTKYLTIYHVIENFMFKKPIVALERQRSGRMFSIRDFQRLYRTVNVGEREALRELFSSVLSMDATGGNTFFQWFVPRWNALTASESAQEIDRALSELGCSFVHAAFSVGGPNSMAEKLSALVYAIRNSIVHNKETEFHLTYETMSKAIRLVIEKFLIPSLEEISFAAIARPNQTLWYQNRELTLFR